MSVAVFGWMIGGLVLLTLGAALLVRGAARLAAAAGIPPLVVGLTVVAFGTSFPELAVSVAAAWSGEPDLALGNVVGSNTFNVLFILGTSALIAPLVVSQQLVRLDVPVMIAVTLLLVVLALDGTIGTLDGVLLFVGIVGYTWCLIRQSMGPAATVAEGAGGDPQPRSATDNWWVRDGLLIFGGLVLLAMGSRWLVDAAIDIATALGASELVIGLTIVAAGTSLPEVATSITATIRGERDIAVGNVVGSNIFNILAVLGLSAIVARGGIAVAPAALTFDIPVALAAAVACLPIFFSGYRIARWEGALFLGYYVAYTGYLIIHAANHPVLPAFRSAMLYFVIPLTIVTLLTSAIRARRRGSPA